MNFVDSTFVALADEQTRRGVFDATALGHMLEATYDADSMGPFQGQLEPLFDEFELGFALPQLATLDGSWSATGGVERTEARFQLAGLPGDGGARVDGVWRGAILARFRRVGEAITNASMAWPEKETVDAAVAAANGGVLPTGAALEQGRKAALLAQVRASLHEPSHFVDEAFEALIETSGATSVGDFLERYRTPDHAAVIQLTHAEPASLSATRERLPIAAVLLIRDQPLSVADLLRDSKTIRERLKQLGLERPPDGSLRLRNPIIVVWVVPATVFDDPDWPGADGDARRKAAGKWLAREGIGLAAVTP